MRRSIDPTDARRRLVEPTGAGRAALAELYRVNRAELRRFRREMSDLLREPD